MERSTPRNLGYRWPAEWEPQQSVWLAWPHDESLWPTDLEPVREVFARLICFLGSAQRVDLMVQDVEVEALARRRLAAAADGTGFPDVRFHRILTDDCWVRDSGPTFLNPAGSSLRPQLALGWHFNGWGKFEPFANDDAVPPAIASVLGIPLFRPDVVLEGGSIDGNGEGTCLTTEQCLLHPNRGNCLGKPALERLLGDNLGVERTIWLGKGLAQDHTDGHVDVIARFVNSTTVVALATSDRADPSHDALADNLRRLERARTAKGERLTVVPLPLPEPVLFEGEPLAAGYANFVIANGLVVVPTWDCPQDSAAIETLGKLFPTRRIIGLTSTILLRGGGSFHCITQQQPLS
ncbi:MAG TPA: agmatine deiminase family protein [Planctomycetia bacterium]|nr:agmatine deiminase family protein [Planctomycetia bacterium]